ncbi:glycoside hydrolase family 2 protein [Micromonospora chersina]|uniref:glycoside hydrolase family 2 protein n=1 Tax=Micromonospora chersina TaxID=47854 RepID=UPI0036C25B23
MDRHHPLSTANWTLRHVGVDDAAPDAVRAGPVPASVPGCVHTDLLAAGLIEDPYIDDAELRLRWIGRTDWEYGCTFVWNPDGHERVDLVCEGLDTVAEPTLNGRHLGGTRNMHRTYRFDVTDDLRAGDNDLVVRFDSAYRYTDSIAATVGDRPNAYPEPSNLIRKMACNYGWDWGPTLVTAGIWRPIGLHAWSTARLARVRPQVTVTDGIGTVEVHIDVERTTAGADVPLTVSATVGGVRATGVAAGDTAVLTLQVPDPTLWWPRGYGDQHRYDLAVELRDPAGEVLGAWQRRIGFRTVELDTSGDTTRSRFTFVVNGVPVFVRGVNWIPDDCFPSRVDRDRYDQRLTQAAEMGVDMVRVWGGGVYESDDFYDLCDEKGLLVWQDFLFACAAYPEEEPLWSEVAAEARDNVARLAPHPSLVLWNGNNENIWGYDVWKWREPLAGRSWGERYYYELLPQIVAEVDPGRPYWAGSPWSGDPRRDPNDFDHGCVHIWDVWNGRDYLAYREMLPPFVSEFGWQSPANWATIRRAVTESELRQDSPLMLHHQKAVGGQANLDRGLARHFPTPAGFDDWHYLTQVNHARAMSVGVEHWRAAWPDCAGAIVWQLNDCWPVASWAAVDGDGRRKPVWYALRRAFADRLVTVQPRPAGPTAVLVNQTAQPWSETLHLRRVDVTAGTLAEQAVAVTVPPRATVEIPYPEELATPGDPACELLVADAGGSRSTWWFVVDRDVNYPAPDAECTVTAEPGGYAVRIRARALLRDVVMQADRVAPDAEVDDALLTLLPGEEAVLHVLTEQRLADPTVLVADPVLRSVGAAVRRAAVELPTAP